MIKEKLGFTLTELMAVVIIVSILAVLGAGYYRKSVEQSRFTEILSITNSIAEAVNRYVMEKQAAGVALENIGVPHFGDLDISFSSCAGNSNTCSIKGRYQVTMQSRERVIGWDTKSMLSYQIRVNTHFGSPKDQVACTFPSENARSFCESMGFTDCTDNTCTKPIR